MQTDSNKYADIRKTTLCHNLDDGQYKQLESLMTEVFLDEGTTFISEGDSAEELYFIKYGEVEVVKIDQDSGTSHTITTIGAGSTIGEVALLDHQERSASIRTVRDSILMKLRFEDLESLSDGHRDLESQIKLNLAEELSQDLRNTNVTVAKSLREKLETAKTRVAMGVIITTLMIGIVTYVFALQIIVVLNHKAGNTTFVSVPILVFFGALAYFASKKSGYPFSMYGVTMKNGKRSLTESLLATVVLIGLIVAIKWLLVQYYPKMQGSKVFDILDPQSGVFRATSIIAVVAYTLFVPIQEFVARGCIQSAFEEFLIGPKKRFWAIIVADLTFSMTHIHLSSLFAIMVFFPGLIWGWLYSRHKTLLGIVVSHMIIGIFAFTIIGFSAMYN